MSIYYIYQLVDPRNGKPFYIGKGTGARAYQHAKFKDGNNNLHKDRVIKKIINEGLEPKIEILFDGIMNEDQAYNLEGEVIRSVGIDNLTNICENNKPPSKKGWCPSPETRKKRSTGLKGIQRSDEWCRNLSECKKGKNNPMYGKKIPCSEKRRLAVIRGKNKDKILLYKEFLTAIKTESRSSAYKRLGISKGIACRLANGSHGIFDAFPELKKLLLS